MSDVLLIPVTTVQPDLVTQTDKVVYIPLASKTAHGIVKIGDGLNITNSGLLSLDETIFEEKLLPITEQINTVDNDLQNHKTDFNNPHKVTKTQVGLGNVENTADADKPVSNAVKLEINKLDTKITSHINDFNNPHRVDKTQIGLSNVDNTSDLEKPISTLVNNELLQIKSDIDKVTALVEGKSSAISFDNYETVIATFNYAATNKYPVGQIVLVNTPDVPDLWVFSVENTHIDYAYIGDYEIVEQLKENGTVQFGYYKLAPMESKGVDLTNYVNLDGMQTISGVKLFKEQLGIVNPENDDINLLKHINNNFLLISSTGENIINIDEQLKKLYFYNEPIAIESYSDDNFVSYTTLKELTDEQKEIARNNIGVSLDNVLSSAGGITDDFKLNVTNATGGVFVNNDQIQMGFIRNGNVSLSQIDEDVVKLTYYDSDARKDTSVSVGSDYVQLKIIGDTTNTVILSSDGFTYNDSSIVTELTLIDSVGANFVSYTTAQELTDEEKAQARNNIGAGTGEGDKGTVVTVEDVPQDTWSADTKVDSIVTNNFGTGSLKVKSTGLSGNAPALFYETSDTNNGSVSTFGVDDIEFSVINMNAASYYTQLLLSENVVLLNKTIDDSAQSMILMSPTQIALNTIGDGKVTYNNNEIATISYVDSLIKTTLNTEV